jgi:hypothetical protein
MIDPNTGDIDYKQLIAQKIGEFTTEFYQFRQQLYLLLGTMTVKDGAVTTAKIADDAVTFAKMQNIGTDRLIGRDTAATGSPEEITVGGGLEFTGSGGIQRSAITGDVAISAGSNSATLGIHPYSLTVLAGNEATFTDGQTLYMGGTLRDPGTGAALRKIYIPKAGTIKVAYLFAEFGTAGSNEAWVAAIRLNDTTDTTIASLSVSTATRLWSNTGLSIAVAQGDFIEIKLTNPTWATNPADAWFGGQIYIE